MKLLLTSAGRYNPKIFDFFLSILPNEISKCSMLLIYYKPDGGISDYIKEDIDFFRELKCDLTVFNMYDNNFKEFNKRFDIIWVCGGNTFHILNKMKETGVFDFVKKSVKDYNSIYFGISAGSIIAGPNIGVSLPWDENDINLKETTGMNIVNFAIIPHYDKKDKEIVNKLKNTADYRIIEITDDEAVFVSDNEHKVIK